MQHLPELLKIVEAALQRDVSKVVRYSEFLAGKLETEGDAASAVHLRKAVSDLKPRSLRPVDVGLKDRVPVDAESRVTLAETTHPRLSETPVILDRSVEQTLSAFIRTYQRLDQLLSAGLTGPGHILLYGPPGCGKTQTARFLAASLELPLVTARLDGLISSFLGSTAKNIRYLFDFADRSPCVLLLDEFDAMAKMRDDPHELGELKRVVNSLLQNMDLMPPGTVVVAATNHEHLLDPAVWRRFDLHVRIDLPDTQARHRLLELYSSPLALAPSDLDVFAVMTQGFSGADISTICEFMARELILSDSESHDFAKAIEYIVSFRGGMSTNLKPIWPSSLDHQIKFLREVDPDTFTYDVLSSLLRVSKGKISKVLSRKAGGNAKRRPFTN